MKELILKEIKFLKEFKEILNPKNILVDDRSISDYIILLKKLSNLYNYYNNKNKINGNFSVY